MVDAPVPATVAVATQSAWMSKINWTQAVSALAAILSWYSGGKIGLTPDQQLALATTIGLLGNAVTFVIKTWFTKTVTPASVANATSTPPLPSTLVHIS